MARRAACSTPDQVRGRLSPRVRQGYRICRRFVEDAAMPLVPPLPGRGRAIAYGSLLGDGNARAACSTSPRLRGEVDLRAEPLRSEANRVRGLVRKLRLAATPPHPDSFAPLRCARNPTSPRTRGEVAQVALPRTSRYQLKCDTSPRTRGEVAQVAWHARAYPPSRVNSGGHALAAANSDGSTSARACT